MKRDFLIAILLLLSALDIHAQQESYVQMDFSGPIEYLVTDAQGRRSGCVPGRNAYYQEIPYAEYGEGSDETLREFAFRSALTDTSFSTTYTIQVFGTRLGLFAGDGGGKQTRSQRGERFHVLGVIDSNQLVSYKFSYSTDSTITPTMMKVIDSNTISQDITDLLKLALITNHGIANSLEQKIENAWNQKEKGEVKAASNMVDAFINEVNAQQGKAITKDAAEILLGDAEQLLKEWSQ